MPFEDAPGLGIEGNLSRPCLAIGQYKRVVMDLGPAQADDLAPAASGQQQEPDDVGLLPAVFTGVLVQGLVKASDLLPRQEARERRSPVPLYAARRVLIDVAAGDREVHDLSEQTESTIGAARGGPTEFVEPMPDLCRSNAIEWLRPEGRQNPTGKHDPAASPGRRFVAVEVSYLPLARDEVPEQRDRARGPGRFVRPRARLERKALPANLRDVLR